MEKLIWENRYELREDKDKYKAGATGIKMSNAKYLNPPQIIILRMKRYVCKVKITVVFLKIRC